MTLPSHLTDMNAEARAHVLGAITSAYAAHDELLQDKKGSALVELDRVIVLAKEARKYLLAENNPRPPAPEEPMLPL